MMAKAPKNPGSKTVTPGGAPSGMKHPTTAQPTPGTHGKPTRPQPLNRGSDMTSTADNATGRARQPHERG